jgi:hypothetical protein
MFQDAADGLGIEAAVILGSACGAQKSRVSAEIGQVPECPQVHGRQRLHMQCNALDQAAQ